MGTNKLIYVMIGLVGLALIFQIFGLMIEYVSDHQQGAILSKFSTISLGLFVLLQGVWLYAEKRDWISSVFFVLCAVGFVSIIVQMV